MIKNWFAALACCRGLLSLGRLRGYRASSLNIFQPVRLSTARNSLDCVGKFLGVVVSVTNQARSEQGESEIVEEA
jgi:hypothetical protein